jgi:hypothetical protein
MQANKESKKALEAFIAKPSDETLRRLADLIPHTGCHCLLTTLFPNNAYVLSLSNKCPSECVILANNRQAFTGYSACSNPFLMDAWKVNPSVVLLSFIQFKAFVDSLEDSNADK